MLSKSLFVSYLADKQGVIYFIFLSKIFQSPKIFKSRFLSGFYFYGKLLFSRIQDEINLMSLLCPQVRAIINPLKMSQYIEDDKMFQ